MSHFQGDSIFWVEVDKIKPNPYQPRREFDKERLADLAESIRQYGVLQPLTVTRTEIIRPDGGITVEYELIAGERRHRASKIAGLTQVPVIIRSGQEDSRMKLELAIIENLQREDINPVERARAFHRLCDEFGLSQIEVARKVGKSREYVANTIRLLQLPEHMLTALAEGLISEGHTRPLLMLRDRLEEQNTLFKEIQFKKLNVRESEGIARRIAREKVRKKEHAPDPEIVALERQLSESLGTRVQIERREVGGKIVIDFFSPEDIRDIMRILEGTRAEESPRSMLERFIEEKQNSPEPEAVEEIKERNVAELVDELVKEQEALRPETHAPVTSADDAISVIFAAKSEVRDVGKIADEITGSNENEEELVEEVTDVSSEEEKEEKEDDLYSINNFSL